MQSKTLSRCALFVIKIVGITFSLIIIFFPTLSLPAEGFYVKPVSSINYIIPQNFTAISSIKAMQCSIVEEEANPGIPVSLQIPQINVEATLEQVGLTFNGAVDVPKGSSNAAWYNLGSRPGENGSAVIVGHYGRWKNGAGSVFDNLNKLKPGDRLYVQDETGAIITFVVRESRKYNPQADATEVFISNDGKPHLNLITCEGIWNKVSKSYSERLVVFTDKE